MLRKIRFYQEKFFRSLEAEWEGLSEEFQVLAADGTRISGSRLEGDGSLVFLVAHGLFAHRRAPGLKEFSESLTRHGEVFAIDLRGQGVSEGMCTVGNKEALDVAAALEYMRERTDSRLVAIGLSMGAAAVVRAAGIYGGVDAAVSISGPAEWRGARGWAARRTGLLWKIPVLLRVVRILTGVRIAPQWEESESPAEVAGKIAPGATLIVHGTEDPFFPPEEAAALYEAAEDPKALWLIPGGGHAEGLFVEPSWTADRGRVDAFVDELVSRVTGLLQ